jgi:hypothetical protein
MSHGDALHPPRQPWPFPRQRSRHEQINDEAAARLNEQFGPEPETLMLLDGSTINLRAPWVLPK